MKEIKPQFIVDIGELGWSLYLSAHYKYLKSKKEPVWVITYPDRFALYPYADGYCKIMPAFKDQYGHLPNECAGKLGISSDELTKFFSFYIASGCKIANRFDNVIPNPGIYTTYPVPKKILVFPRYREHKAYSPRNLSRDFYMCLIESLCKAYPQYDVVAVGKGEAYDLPRTHANFINKVRDDMTIQDVLEMCTFAVAAVGGTSSLPKLAALQGVPTFVIGHEKLRFTEDENWKSTRYGFYEIEPGQYNALKFTVEIYDKIKDFIDDTIKPNTPDRQG